jgi:protein gp37
MSTTKIEWATHVWNPIVGCSVVSPGCTNCYAMKMAARLEAMGRRTDVDDNGYATGWINPLQHYCGTTKSSNAGAVWTGKVAMAPDSILTAPLRWRKPKRIFVNSMSDLFHENVLDEWIDLVFAVMALCPQHTFMVLTKRADRMRGYFAARQDGDPWAEAADEIADLIGMDDHPVVLEPRDIPIPNVWLGVSVENQKAADGRIPHLLGTPAAVRFISAEPLLGPVDLRHFDLPGGYEEVYPLGAPTGVEFGTGEGPGPRLDWVIAGGESGPGARPMHPDWARSLRDQCAEAGTAFFFKQWGGWIGATRQPGEYGTTSAATGETRFWPENETARHHTWDDDGFAFRVGKTRAGRLLDGVEHNSMPTISGGAK